LYLPLLAVLNPLQLRIKCIYRVGHLKIYNLTMEKHGRNTEIPSSTNSLRVTVLLLALN
jgi:hypothetical protein